MAAPPTYGLTAAGISGRQANFELTANTTPTLTEGAEILLEQAAHVAGLLESYGFEPDQLTGTGDDAVVYYYARDLLANRFLATLIPMQDGSAMELAGVYMERADDCERKLDQHRSKLGDARPSGERAPSRIPTPDYVRRKRTTRRKNSTGRLSVLLDDYTGN